MGTRNLTMFINKVGDVKIAQYGQWDGYPSGKGLTVLNFLKDVDLDKFDKKLTEKARFKNDDDEHKMQKFLKKIGSKYGNLNLKQYELYTTEYPFFSRDLGADILLYVKASRRNPIILADNRAFAADSLFCEWAYVIDMQKRFFEVYRGFNKKVLPKDARFKHLEDVREDYKPIRLLSSYSLDKLPTKDEFLKLEG